MGDTVSTRFGRADGAEDELSRPAAPLPVTEYGGSPSTPRLTTTARPRTSEQQHNVNTDDSRLAADRRPHRLANSTPRWRPRRSKGLLHETLPTLTTSPSSFRQRHSRHPHQSTRRLPSRQRRRRRQTSAWTGARAD